MFYNRGGDQYYCLHSRIMSFDYDFIHRSLTLESKTHEVRTATIYLKSDNQVAPANLDRKKYKCNNHQVEMRHLWSIENIQKDQIQIEYLSTNNMKVDEKTKSPKKVKYEAFVQDFGIRKMDTNKSDQLQTMKWSEPKKCIQELKEKLRVWWRSLWLLRMWLVKCVGRIICRVKAFGRRNVK